METPRSKKIEARIKSKRRVIEHHEIDIEMLERRIENLEGKDLPEAEKERLEGNLRGQVETKQGLIADLQEEIEEYQQMKTDEE